ncbi:MAG: YchJ family metal-binding protein [Cyanobacteria bacterium J06623_4]
MLEPSKRGAEKGGAEKGQTDKGATCTCGSRRGFQRCCGPYLAGDAIAPTAEALMRSRYSAFATGNIDYLLATRHPTTSAPDDRRTLEKSVRQTQWTHLLIIGTHKGQRKDKTGTVEFVAAYRAKLSPEIARSPSSAGANRPQPMAESKVLQQLHEKSRFVKEGSTWFYVEGDILPPYEPKRTQRCWCGSEKPYKRCHG